MRRVEVIGHAGAAGFHPHNSAASLRKAVELGVDRIEVDILAASGDVLILNHDLRLRFEGSWRETRVLTLEQLRTIIAEALTFDEAVEITGGYPPFLLDIKGRHYVEPLIAAIRAAESGHQMSACGTHARALRSLHRAFPAMPIGLSRGHSLTKISRRWLRSAVGKVISLFQIPSLIVTAKWCGATEVMIQHHICTRILVQAVHLAGIRVNAWTVDAPSDISRVLLSGADGVISNRPDLVIKSIGEANLLRIQG